MSSPLSTLRHKGLSGKPMRTMSHRPGWVGTRDRRSPPGASRCSPPLEGRSQAHIPEVGAPQVALHSSPVFLLTIFLSESYSRLRSFERDIPVVPHRTRVPAFLARLRPLPLSLSSPPPVSAGHHGHDDGHGLPPRNLGPVRD